MEDVLSIPELLETILLHLDITTLLVSATRVNKTWKAVITLIHPVKNSLLPGLRMGTLYDVVQYRAGHHERNSMWFRVVWNQAREPYNTNSSQEKCRKMLQQTNVVVEFYHVNDGAFVEHHHEPPDLALFDMRFRSEDYQHINIEIHEKTWDGPDSKL
ncbi:hypothetical protein DL766_007196 [Monosporascus sp. MC13-8B]|uniref:F-box domain-containing protein n=1 Tax=Monosporascus cannonballus TaxID=155416 RepID=A0ABY0H8F3_9PEZI|nr:hypothetical protein DL762_005724 [Monosporascus cannonballus]RYO98233.1 hypothetical protein DL763_002333 [Monosporascus cannonballus]RYP24889.1 hypothetical protein DL766_007196 [Monosporascus sp. MC13-8B]